LPITEPGKITEGNFGKLNENRKNHLIKKQASIDAGIPIEKISLGEKISKLTKSNKK